MIYAIVLFITTCLLFYFIKVRKAGKAKERPKPVRHVTPPQPLQINKTGNGLSVITWIKNGKQWKKQTVGYNKPRSMTTTERLFYLMKPNLQYWYDNGTLSNGKAKE